jgi:hypothetical protein
MMYSGKILSQSFGGRYYDGDLFSPPEGEASQGEHPLTPPNNSLVSIIFSLKTKTDNENLVFQSRILPFLKSGG